MKKLKKVLIGLVATGMAVAGLAACSDADTVSHNLSKEADSFGVWRQVVLYNGITDKYILEIDGYCSVGNNDDADKVSITCKVDGGNGTDSYTKDIYTKSDNTMVFVHQLQGVHVSPDHYKVIMKPETVFPSIDVQ